MEYTKRVVSTTFKDELLNVLPDPYEDRPNMTDCEMWSEDIVHILQKLFTLEGHKYNEVTEQQLRDAEKKLRSALIWFYQTHL